MTRQTDDHSWRQLQDYYAPDPTPGPTTPVDIDYASMDPIQRARKNRSSRSKIVETRDFLLNMIDTFDHAGKMDFDLDVICYFYTYQAKGIMEGFKEKADTLTEVLEGMK